MLIAPEKAATQTSVKLTKTTTRTTTAASVTTTKYERSPELANPNGRGSNKKNTYIKTIEEIEVRKDRKERKRADFNICYHQQSAGDWTEG